MIKAIIFDYYGVITTDQYFVWLQRHPQIHDEHAQAIEPLSHDQDSGISGDEFFSRLAKIADTSPDTLRQEFRIHGLEHEALIDYIRHLRRKHFKTAIVSNSDAGLYAEAEKHHLTRLFELILCSEEAGFTKPDPRIFRMALDRLEVEPHEALFVDDRDYNVRGAEAAGISGIIYTGLADLRSELIRRGLDEPIRS
ncbi:MAG: hypothetical protein NVSMB39_2140 [Candidatus Saccharimonadales bacterium]